MNHIKKLLAILKQELKKVEEEVVDEDGQVSSTDEIAFLEGFAVAISLVENYEEQELSTDN